MGLSKKPLLKANAIPTLFEKSKSKMPAVESQPHKSKDPLMRNMKGGGKLEPYIYPHH